MASRRADLVRGRLLDKLASRWVVPVTVVSGPAGYGKSTLLRQAVALSSAVSEGVDLLVRCTPRSRTLSRFVEVLHRAVEAPKPPSTSVGVAELVPGIVDAMWRRAPEQVALLIDDVHEIGSASEAAELLRLIAASLPSNGHLVLCGRSSPPFPLARLQVEDRVVRIDRDELAFTPAELAEFAALRGISAEQVMSCGGWPALAELSAGSTAGVVRTYVGEEVLSALSPTERRQLALLSHVGWFDSELASAVLGRTADVAALLEVLPLVEAPAGGGWSLHGLWQSLLAGEVSRAEVADARRRAGLELVRRGELSTAVPLLIDAAAWDDVGEAVLAALSPARPPVARDVLDEWLSKLPRAARAEPSGQLLAAVATAEDNPEGACLRIEAAAASLRARGDFLGELTCLVQLGLQAWWSNDRQLLASVAARVLELEGAGYDDAAPFACLGRALLFDMADDSGRMLGELRRISPSLLNEPWLAIVGWLRSIALLQLGHATEAEQAAAEAMARDAELAALIESTRLQALWFQGKTEEVVDVLPLVIEQIAVSGSQHHLALAAGQASVAYALHGEIDRAARLLDRARGCAVMAADAPLVETVLSVAEAAVAVASGDEATAQAALASYLSRYAIGDGIPVAVQRRYLPFFYVLVPETRPVWDDMQIGPAWRLGRDLARAVVDAREHRWPPTESALPHDAHLVRAHLPPSWAAELALVAISSGRDEGRRLLDAAWTAMRPAVVDIAAKGPAPLRREARAVLGRLPAPPTGHIELLLLGPVELRRNGELVDAPFWRRDRVRTLLIYLAMRRSVSRSQIADDLWPELDPDSQSSNLRVTLTYLLRILEPSRARRAPSFFVRQHGNNLVLHPDRSLTVDLWEFDELYELASAAERRGAPTEFLDLATRALALWRGEPAGDLSLAWAMAAVEQRRVRFVTTALRAGELHLARRRVDLARDLAERALAADPWVEDAYRLLIACHQASGDELARQRAVDRYRASIEELGLDAKDAARIVDQRLEAVRARPAHRWSGANCAPDHALEGAPHRVTPGR